MFPGHLVLTGQPLHLRLPLAMLVRLAQQRNLSMQQSLEKA